MSCFPSSTGAARTTPVAVGRFEAGRNALVRDRKHQGHRRFIQPLHSPLNRPVRVASTPRPAPNFTAAHARIPDSRRHPARQTHRCVPVAQPHCASGSDFPQIAQRRSTRSALEPREDPACLGAAHHGSELHHPATGGAEADVGVGWALRRLTWNARAPAGRPAGVRCFGGMEQLSGGARLSGFHRE